MGRQNQRTASDQEGIGCSRTIQAEGEIEVERSRGGIRETKFQVDHGWTEQGSGKA